MDFGASEQWLRHPAFATGAAILVTGLGCTIRRLLTGAWFSDGGGDGFGSDSDSDGGGDCGTD